MKTKKIIILEGPDASGKDSLAEHIKMMVNGKCHIIHSNFDKELPKKNHRRQHKLIAKFVSKQFSKKYYTGNDTVILNRCYISDMTYGQLGYGSKGTIEDKYNYLHELFAILTKNKDVEVTVVYCKPSKSAYNPIAREELLNSNENNKMIDIYDSIMNSIEFAELLCYYNIKYYDYNFNEDPNYIFIDRAFKEYK